MGIPRGLTALLGWLRRRLAVIGYLVMAAGMVWGLARLEQLIDDEHREDRIEDAERCVDNHERVDLLRNAIEQSTGRGAHAAVTAVGEVAIRLYDPGDLPPDLLDQLGAEADTVAAAEAEVILADYPDPECDLTAARDLLDR